MYIVYKIFSSMSKICSNVLVILAVPFAFILAALGWAAFCIEDIFDSIGAGELLDPNSGNTTLVEIVPIIKYIGLAVGLLFTILLVIIFISWILKKVFYKKIADNYITRNKEWRNRDINKVIEKLESYRYRD